MRSSLLLCMALLVACTCERKTTSSQLTAKAARKKAGAGQVASIKDRAPDSRSWYVGVKPSMAKLAHLAGEVSHRLARPNFPIADATRVLDRVVAMIPDVADPAFAAAKKTLKDRTAALLISSNPRADFNRVIEACVGCHVRYAPGSVPRVQALRVVSVAPT